jgi:hypothetical protein
MSTLISRSQQATHSALRYSGGAPCTHAHAREHSLLRVGGPRRRTGGVGSEGWGGRRRGCLRRATVVRHDCEHVPRARDLDRLLRVVRAATGHPPRPPSRKTGPPPRPHRPHLHACTALTPHRAPESLRMGLGPRPILRRSLHAARRNGAGTSAGFHFACERSASSSRKRRWCSLPHSVGACATGACRPRERAAEDEGISKRRRLRRHQAAQARGRAVPVRSGCSRAAPELVRAAQCSMECGRPRPAVPTHPARAAHRLAESDARDRTTRGCAVGSAGPCKQRHLCSPSNSAPPQ